MLGNIHPTLQIEVLDQMRAPRFVIADTMNFWIERTPNELAAMLGRIDALVINMNDRPTLLRNDTASGHHWITLRLVGTRSNRSAIGARVRIEAGRRRQTTTIRGDGSYLSHSDTRAHFGLGAAARVDRMEIRWPSGVIETVTGVAADRFYVATEGAGLKALP